jgi:hypothetical protein
MSVAGLTVSFVFGFLLAALLLTDPWRIGLSGIANRGRGASQANDSDGIHLGDAPAAILVGALEVGPHLSADHRFHAFNASDEADFVRLAHRCTDKTTDHQYQLLYSKVFAPYRHPTQEVVAEFNRTGKKPFKLLEIGLGCNMRCVAGGFRLLQAYLPLVEYHGFELDFGRCVKRYKKADMSVTDAEYLGRHVCHGSSDSPDAIKQCADKFGPFDLVIDDASHIQHHVIAGMNIWLPSAYLKPGGTYIIEDLQTGFWPSYGGSVEEQRAHNTGPEVLKDILELKLAWNPHTNDGHRETVFARSVPDPNRVLLARLISDIHCSSEICALTKHKRKDTDPTAPT